MKIIYAIKNATLEIKLAIVFAASMLLCSVLISGHEHTNSLLILQVGLYFVVTGLVRKSTQCRTSAS